MTLGSLSLSSYIGNMVDRLPKVRFARQAIVVQKLCQAAIYVCFVLMFSSANVSSKNLQGRSTSLHDLLQHRQALASSGVKAGPTSTNWLQLALLVTCATTGRLATIAIDLAVDRDWYVCPSGVANLRVLIVTKGNSDQLTLFNTYNRRAWLVCKLLAPLFVSTLTSIIGYPRTCFALLGVSIATTATELVWIGIVWKAFPALQNSEEARNQEGYALLGRGQSADAHEVATPKAGWQDFIDFVKMPVFMSELEWAQ